MATTVAENIQPGEPATMQSSLSSHDDPFLENGTTSGQQSYVQHYSSRFDLDHPAVGVPSSPTQVKRALEAHLLDTEKRLQDTKTLGESLLAQQSTLQDKLREVEERQDESEITPELRQQLASIGKEHDDVSREIARSLLVPKLRAAGPEDANGESSVYTSQASGSPTKISAPSRRQRNQPTNRTADVQFATELSVSLLGQVRALQAAVAERDEALKLGSAERLKLESDVQGLSQRLRTHDENEQRYKDENWNLVTQNHELHATIRESSDKEKKLNASLAAALTEKTRLVNEIEDTALAHGKLVGEQAAAKKAHETELHSLKRDVDAADSERLSMQMKLDELTAQNQELARAMAGKYRNITPNQLGDLENDKETGDREAGTPEHSPPPSPTKATPRHGGLESETLRSSLHHAHRQIQNLKGNIHREKTEKIELKRMLQEARDELEQQRGGISSGQKKPKSRNEIFKKPLRPDMLGGSRRSRTDVEMEDEDWEDQSTGSPSGLARRDISDRGFTHMTDMSDAYQTAHETENDFETADERHTATESEAFMTGAESLAGDSTDELTETEDNVSRASRTRTTGSSVPVFGTRHAHRNSFNSTASTSAGEEDDQLQTPIQAQPTRFRLRNGRSSYSRQSQVPYEDTPGSVRTSVADPSSPITVTGGRSPPAPEQSLFAELGDFDDASSDKFGTPARSSVFNTDTTGSAYVPSRIVLPEEPLVKPTMVDSAMMTEPWGPEHVPASLVASPRSTMSGILAANSIAPSVEQSTPAQLVSALPSSLPASPQRQVHSSTQYTPQRSLESPHRNTAFITPPRTAWDEVHENESPVRGAIEQTTPETPETPFAYSDVLIQETKPVSSPAPVFTPPPSLTFSTILSQDTEPVVPEIVEQVPSVLVAAGSEASTQTEEPRLDEQTTPESAGAAGLLGGGLLAGAAAALGLTLKSPTVPVVNEEISSEKARTIPEPNSKMLHETAVDNSVKAVAEPMLEPKQSPKIVPILYSSNDQGAQTTLTAEQIEQALQVQTRTPVAPVAPIAIPTYKSSADATRATSPLSFMTQEATGVSSAGPSSTLPASPPRPSSATSGRSISIISQTHPPLPFDYRSNIARANSMVVAQPVKKDPSTAGNAMLMGPPLLPASAMRRPRTPAESMRSPTREGTASRASQSSRYQRGTMESRVSRRSSVSSFASELDERFNIRAEGSGAGARYEGEPATDPRMIQAITQTMIGEFLWKYTRKAGSKEMSATRHRRYFWVHPYNKTLHWSTHDPQSAGGKENRSKGVIIESVRVVTDDNSMPPGLHRKSLEITTPGRMVKLTASTGQRHETWFNALSYLLLRGEPADERSAYVTGGNRVVRDDHQDMNAGGYNARLVPNTSRVSMSSYNSRTTQATSVHRMSRQALPSNMTSAHDVIREVPTQPEISQTLQDNPNEARTARADQDLAVDRNRTIRARSMSRISKIFGSVSHRPSQQLDSQTAGVQQSGGHRRVESESSIYDASVVSDSRKDSAEELRQEMLRQEAAGLGSAGGLENVRACCDGKHDVSTLRGEHRHSSQRSTLSSVTERMNRSVSRRV